MICPHCTTPLAPAPMRPLEHFERWWKCSGWRDNKNTPQDGCGRAYWYDGPSILAKKDPQQKMRVTDALIQITDEQRMWAERL